MDKKAWIIFSVVVVALFAGLVILSNKDSVDVSSIDNNKIVQPSAENGNIGDHVFGKKDSPVVLMEYGDFQCPGCGEIAPVLATLSEKYEGQIAFVFRNFPLTSIHQNTLAASAAAEAAGLQDRYWPMHNLIYNSQSDWERLSAAERTDAFAGYADQLGLDTTKFKEDLGLPRISKKISYDQARGKEADVTGTPTIYLDGKVLDPKTYNNNAEFDKAIQTALKDHNIALPKADK